ncbi:MAG: hypothetical protein R3C14_24305 [Caldilineaceae bacterium]
MMAVSSDATAPSLNCTEFQQIVERYLAHPDGEMAHLPAALAHLQGCRRCQAQWDAFLQAFIQDQEDQLTCTAAQAQLPEYVNAQLGSADAGAAARWHALQVHLAHCPACHAMFQEVSEMVQIAAMPSFQPERTPAPDLSFLAPPAPQLAAPAQVHWRMDEVGALIIEFSRSLLASVAPPLMVGLKGDATRKTLCRIDLQEVFADLAVSIVALEAFQDPSHCELLVEVDIPSRGGWPNLAGIAVVIRHGAQVLASRQTDAYGKAVITEIRTADLAELTVQVQPNG